MCTAVTLTTDRFYFGRTLDLDVDFGDAVAVMPRRYPLVFRNGETLSSHYAMLGMAALRQGYPLYAEAANEKGLCIAGLHFPQNARYSPREKEGAFNVAPFELIPHLLGRCADLSEAKSLLEKTHLYHLSFSDSLPATPLHWLIADRNGALVWEVSESGVSLMENPVGVLTNEPPLSFHLLNLHQYENLSPRGALPSPLGKEPFSLGLGAHGLPGDYSSTSRFVKAAWLRHVVTSALDAPVSSVDGREKTPSEPTKLGQDGLLALFSILSSVAPPVGSVLTQTGACHFTRYTCGIDTACLQYVYTTHRALTPVSVSLFSCDLDAEALSLFPV